MENEEIIENAKRISQDILNKGQSIIPICQVFRKDGTIEVIGMQFDGYEAKEKMREMLKKFILQKEVEKYVITFDAKMTTMSREKEGKEPQVMDVVLISVYSPQNRITRGYPYGKDKKLTDKEDEIIKMDRRDGQDCWDIWGESVKLGTKEQKAYQEYKNKHRELYKGIDSQDDALIDLKKKGKIESIDIGMGFKLKIYRLKNKVMFEALNAHGEIFIASPAMNEDEDFKKRLKEVTHIMKMVGDKLEKE
jgi:hypothetical protein